MTVTENTNDRSAEPSVIFNFPDPLPGGPKTAVCTKIGKINGGQDGAVFGKYLFRFDASGNGKVYLPENGEWKKTAEFTLEKQELMKVHSNAVFFGPYFCSEDDEFPLLYTNVYNSYSSAEDRREGVCGVYRITRAGESFRGELVQILRIGFTENLGLWKSLPDRGDVRPYGNFICDSDTKTLWAFTMRDKEKVTRFFSFALPKPEDGENDDRLGCPCVTLTENDILDRFDADYSNYIQGACLFDGKICSLEGFTDNTGAPARMQVFDLRAKKTAAVLDFQGNGMTREPEFVSEYDGALLYSDGSGNLFRIEFS